MQRIVSKPPVPDNRRQTILQPELAQVLIPSEIKIPNVVYWAQPVVPPPPSAWEVQRKLAQIRIPRLPTRRVTVADPLPPKLATVNPRLSEIPIAPPTVAEIPKLPVPEEKPVVTPGSEKAPERKTAIAPSPPTVLPETDLSALRSLIAVGVAPGEAQREISVPPGYRSGDFHMSPEGRESDRDVSPSEGGKDSSARVASTDLGNRDLAEIRVPHLSISGGKPVEAPGPVVTTTPPPRPSAAPQPPPASDLSKLLARATRPTLLPEMSRGQPVESGLFGGRRVYTVYLNMPNLTSGSGSWVLRFAELEGEGQGDGSEISSPVAVRKVDPQYDPSAVRERVEGTVTLVAHILRNGTVANIQVLRSVDPRLDLSAIGALTRWQFQPARKNGIPVDLEVLVQIPFRLPGF